MIKTSFVTITNEMQYSSFQRSFDSFVPGPNKLLWGSNDCGTTKPNVFRGKSLENDHVCMRLGRSNTRSANAGPTSSLSKHQPIARYRPVKLDDLSPRLVLNITPKRS